jgi:hypothetical protein
MACKGGYNRAGHPEAGGMKPVMSNMKKGKGSKAGKGGMKKMGK